MKFDEKLTVKRTHERTYILSTEERNIALATYIREKTGHVIDPKDLLVEDRFQDYGIGASSDWGRDLIGLRITVTDENEVTT